MDKTIYNNIPLIKYTLLCIIGILIGLYYPSNVLILSSIFILCFTIFLALSKYFIQKLKRFQNLILFESRILPIAFLIIGYLLSIYHQNNIDKTYFGNFISSKKQIVELKILKDVQEKDNSFKVIGEVKKIHQGKKIIQTSGKLLLYFQKDNSVSRLMANDVIYLVSNLKIVEPAKNPNEFDFKGYLRFQNIFHQGYVKSKDWKLIKPSKNNFSNLLYTIKSYLQTLININIHGKNERAVASALLLGNRTYLTDDILKAFSSSGATHILAVSGLHVGLFYGIIAWIFGFLKKYKNLKVLHPIITILFIWFYVALTGGSPSVIRAATMFSFVAIGLSLSRYVNIYNIIACSALLIILINPFIITEVGFQLSYFAVIGIIFLQKKIYNLFYIKNFIGDKIWMITSVSIAAQISTFPLIVLYFHQFPNLFFISNIIVIPAATVILYGGITMFLFSWNDTISKFIGEIVSFIIKCLNESLEWLEKIPYAVSDKIYINYYQAIFFYLAILLFIFCIEKRSKKLFFTFLLVVGIIISTFHYKDHLIRNQTKLIVYHVPGKSAIEIIDKNNAYHLIDSSLIHNDNLLTFRIKHNWWEKQVRKQYYDFKKLKSKNLKNLDLIQINNKRVGVLKNSLDKLSYTLDLDYLVVYKGDKLNFKKLSKQIKAKTYIFDTSNKKYKEKNWKKECKNLGLNCYFVSDSTAFEIDL